MTTILILNIVFSTSVIAGIVGLLASSIATQDRAVFSAPALRIGRSRMSPSALQLVQPAGMKP